MSIKINEDFMAVAIDGSVIVTAACTGDDRWTIDGWPGHFTRNGVITAFVLADRLAAGYGDDDPFVIGWREELR
jgi:hypothetical protein